MTIENAILANAQPIVVCAMYKFVTLEITKTYAIHYLMEWLVLALKAGTLLLAKEGINGTIAGTREGIDDVLAWLNNDPRTSGISYKESLEEQNPFYRTKVKLKKEIATMGVDGIDPKHIVGTYVKPKDWNALINEQSYSVAEAAKALGVITSLLYNWKRKADAEASDTALFSNERDELKRLLAETNAWKWKKIS